VTTWGWISLALCASAVAAIVVVNARGRRTVELRERFGAEYDRTIANRASRAKGEHELAERQERRRRLDIQALSPEACKRYSSDWQTVQSRFVDGPAAAVSDADRLLERVLSDRGYPRADFDQRVAHVSVDHGEMVAHYRAAHETYSRFVDGDATSTEELRRSLLNYRALFDELLEPEQQVAVAR
jgi:hypothetical protein